ncbi:hypothetical protein TTHERM_00010920 (macronuclear) [Tetrahymena thermophila SB210]|uniref:Uncharacterized protein n=1 Tax=Tetrahymena thermophila (strain SB210) TaxID=312017 RepID=Q22S40_TETTS|nr:hypothetical protein TTHERM_00010920 [Tetrahymena thermophila SB210]EAR87932.2 hypothetical protein TTHERM_00010920 [Tetrahymena thermophila SB210]|eukprot:XP_001008177.2 hypothetical protein TTHERM_00010920 [Tetrahymena thermophila SB210]
MKVVQLDSFFYTFDNYLNNNQIYIRQQNLNFQKNLTIMKALITQPRNKFEEQLKQIEFEQIKRPFLYQKQDAKPETLSIQSFKLFDQLKYPKQFGCFFMPTHLYEQESFDITINESKVNLLNCMYAYSLQDKKNVVITLQDFNNNFLILGSYQASIQLKEDDYIYDVSVNAAILGSKFILLVVKSRFQIQIFILTLDLVLVMQYQKNDVFFIKKECYIDYDFNKKSIHIFENEIDYSEDGIIYYQHQQILLRIDTNSKQVISRIFKENFNILLRLLPVTQSEFNYYFKSCQKETLSGYDNSKKENFVLFTIINDKIYQINQFNLMIIRITKCDSLKYIKDLDYDNYHEQIQAFVIPIQIQNRQKKEFSNWTFLIKNQNQPINLIDWKEKNLFQKQKIKQGDQFNEFKQLNQDYFISNLCFLKGNTLVEFKNANRYFSNTFTYQLNILKKKGNKNYEYNFKAIYKIQNEITKLLKILKYYSPILKNNLITFPCLIIDGNYEQLKSLHLGLITSNEQKSFYLKKLEISQEEMSQQQNSQFIVYEWATHFAVYKLAKNQTINKIQNFSFEVKYNNRWEIYPNNIEQFHFNNSKSELIFIRRLNYCYKNEKKYFGIFDINKNQIIKESVRFSKYTVGLYSNYNSETKEFILLFKNIVQDTFLAFYSFDLIKFKFKFINMHKSYFYLYNTSSFNKGDIFTVRGESQIIQFDRKKKFEIKKIIEIKDELLKFNKQNIKKYFI